MNLTLRQATVEDLPALRRLQAESVTWLAAKGLEQWQPGQPRAPRDRPGSHLNESVDSGTCWVAEANSEIVATITVDDIADPEFWSAEEAMEALYVHRMVVARSLAGNDIGAALLDWADELARREQRSLLRLDAWRTNTALHDYYRSQGFKRVRVVDLPHRGSGALFERRVSLEPGPRLRHVSADGKRVEIGPVAICSS